MQSNLRKRLNISRWAIQYPRLTVSFWLAVMVAGLLAFSSLKYALFPDITFPVVIVTADSTFTTLAETESQVTQPLEQAFGSLEQLDEVRSRTYPGKTVVSLVFFGGAKVEAAQVAVEQALFKVILPLETTVGVTPFNLNESAVMSYGIMSLDKTLADLEAFTQGEILPEIAAVPGVLRVDLLGTGKAPPETTETATLTKNPPTLVRLNGENTLAFQVIKRGNANTLEVVQAVEAVVNRLQTQFSSTASDVKLVLTATQADFIQEASQATLEALFGAIALAVLIIYPFLRNLRATLITALAIPTSLLGTFIVMALFHFNLETITLLALALVIGVIVDDAIVDVENITRHLEAGESPQEAALRGTDEIGLSVTASTLTIVAVFLPVAFMKGTIGNFFLPFGVTISAAVLISLLVARTLSPVLAVWWLRPPVPHGEQGTGNREDRGSDSLLPLPHTPYRRLLHWSLHHRQLVMGIAVVSFAAGIALIPLIPQGFIPQLDRGEFNITFVTDLPKIEQSTDPPPPTLPTTPPPGKSEFRQESFNWLTDLAQSPERFLLRRSRRLSEPLETVVLQNENVASVFTLIGRRGEPNQGTLAVRLKPERTATTAEVQQQIRDALPPLPGVEVSVEDLQFVELDSSKPLQIALLGPDPATLSTTAQTLKTRLETVSGLADLEVSLEEDNLFVERLDGQPVVYLTANLGENVALGDKTNEVVAIAKPLLPPDITLQLQGDSEISNEVLSSFGGTLTFAVLCMLVVLFIPFGRLLEPLVVGLSLPLSIVGAMLALLITQSDFGMISLMGFIFLLGLLDKNALLLMDYINQLRQQGLNRTEAILRTGVVRFRPILMTTFSTIFGMLPLALGLGAGAELRQPMAVSIIGGLITSTLLSLIIVPVLYTLLEDGWLRLKSLWGK